MQIMDMHTLYYYYIIILFDLFDKGNKQFLFPDKFDSS